MSYVDEVYENVVMQMKKSTEKKLCWSVSLSLKELLCSVYRG